MHGTSLLEPHCPHAALRPLQEMGTLLRAALDHPEHGVVLLRELLHYVDNAPPGRQLLTPADLAEFNTRGRPLLGLPSIPPQTFPMPAPSMPLPQPPPATTRQISLPAAPPVPPPMPARRTSAPGHGGLPAALEQAQRQYELHLIRTLSTNYDPDGPEIMDLLLNSGLNGEQAGRVVQVSTAAVRQCSAPEKCGSMSSTAMALASSSDSHSSTSLPTACQ